MQGWEVVERAKEELELLEAEHPNRYQCLKMDLKALISDFDHDLKLNSSSPSVAYVDTQESSTRRKKRKKGGCGNGTVNKKRRSCKTDAVLEKAQQCLHKIQRLKTSFFL